ncbi:MAG TPA: metallophosphoesterase family protein [Pirellulales bacterium]|jgi:hypothetical protein|nr:metallophosphoesterase family protein [Pirellulales bacterium]
MGEIEQHAADQGIHHGSRQSGVKDRAGIRLGVVSDSHGHAEHVWPAVHMLESLEVDLVLHCGDVGGAAIVAMFKRWPTHFVYGNVDDPSTLRAAIAETKQTFHAAFGTLKLCGREIAFTHGDDSRALSRAIDSSQYALVCHGHTHVARNERRGPTLVLNPGALYRANPHSMAVVDIPADQNRPLVATIIRL